MNRRLVVLPLSLALLSLVGCEEDSSSAPDADDETGTSEAQTGGLDEETDTDGDTETEGGGAPDIGEGVA